MQNGQKGELLLRDVILFLAETENVLPCKCKVRSDFKAILLQ